MTTSRWLFSLLGSCLLATWADAQDSAERGAPTPNLEIQAALLDQQYCATTPLDEVVGFHLTLSISVRNRTEDRVILPRKPRSGSPRVAASVETGREGRVEFQNDIHWFPEPLSQGVLGERPGKDYVVLKPGGTFSKQVKSVLLVRRKGTQELGGTIAEGSRRAIQVPIEWWAPLEQMHDEEVQELWDRWLPYGKLVVGTSLGNWVEVSLPEIGQPGECDQQ